MFLVDYTAGVQARPQAAGGHLRGSPRHSWLRQWAEGGPRK